MTRNILQHNPLRRYRKSFGLTQEEMADTLGVSAKSVWWAENAVYETPLEAYCTYIIQNSEATVADLEREYAEFRAFIQQQTSETVPIEWYRFSGDISDVKNITVAGRRISPITDFRVNWANFTRSELITKYLLNPGQLYKLEQGYVRTLPMQISDALMRCGAPKEFLRELSERTKLYARRS